MRLSHVYAGDVEGLSADIHRVIHHRFFRDGKPEGSRVQRGAAHIHTGRSHQTVCGVEVHFPNTGAGLDPHIFLFHQTVVIQVLAHAPQGVARRGALAAVGVEQPDLCISNVGILHQDDPVGADAVMPVTEGDTQGLRAGDLAVEVFQEDVIVSAGL